MGHPSAEVKAARRAARSAELLRLGAAARELAEAVYAAPQTHAQALARGRDRRWRSRGIGERVRMTTLRLADNLRTRAARADRNALLFEWGERRHRVK